LDVSKEVGQEVKIETTKYMFTSRHQAGGQNHNIKAAKNLLKI
jgi:hypothetical protein